MFRVLAVDDDTTCLRIAEACLKRCNYTGLNHLFGCCKFLQEKLIIFLIPWSNLFVYKCAVDWLSQQSHFCISPITFILQSIICVCVSVFLLLVSILNNSMKKLKYYYKFNYLESKCILKYYKKIYEGWETWSSSKTFYKGIDFTTFLSYQYLYM